MDPIHPIVPLPPTIPPVTPAPLVGRIDRDNPRGRSGEDERRRRRPRPDSERVTDPAPYAHEATGDDEQPGPHISVIA